jgi:Ohr subfamily peroxiredoxin
MLIYVSICGEVTQSAATAPGFTFICRESCARRRHVRAFSSPGYALLAGTFRLPKEIAMSALYTATATATNGRTGSIRSDDGHLSHPLSMPKELGGPGGDGTNPEQLFAAGYAACFGSALGLVARQKKIAIGEVAITAKVGLVKDETSFKLEVTLHGEFKSIPQDQAHELMEAAHAVCPYSKATRGNITVTLTP